MILSAECEYLIPVGQRLSWGSAEPHSVSCPDEGNVEPECNPVDSSSLKHVELDGDLNAVKICLMSCLEVDDMPHGLCCADVHVKSVNNGLSEVFSESCASEWREVNTVEVFLIPEVNLKYSQNKYINIFTIPDSIFFLD